MIKEFISMFYIWIIVQTIKNIDRHSYFCFEFRTSILNLCAHFFIILRCAICVKSLKSSLHIRIDFIFRWISFAENHVFTLNFIHFISLLLNYIWIEYLNIRLLYSFKRLIVCWFSRIAWWKIWTRFWIRKSCHRFFFYKANNWFRCFFFLHHTFCIFLFSLFFFNFILIHISIHFLFIYFIVCFEINHTIVISKRSDNWRICFRRRYTIACKFWQ